jgi:hypothetical protein
MDALILMLLLSSVSRVKINSIIKESLQGLPEFETCSNIIRKLQNWRLFILKVHSGERSKDGQRGRSLKHNNKIFISPLIFESSCPMSSLVTSA